MYLKDIENWQTIPCGWKQIFQNKFIANISQNEIIKMKNEGVLKDRDLKIAEFLFRFRFATLEQIELYLESESSSVSLKSRLEKLVTYRVLNKFILAETEDEQIKNDGLQFYCLDLGGKYLLTHYTNVDTIDWYVTRNMLVSENISKALISTQFYLKLRKTCGHKIVFFNVLPEVRIAKRSLILNFEFCLNIDGSYKYFIGEIAKENDLPDEFRKKVDKIESLITSNYWKKYYNESENPPILFVFSETDVLINKCAKIISETTMISNFRLSTEHRIFNKNLYDAGAFLKYLEHEGKLKEVRSVIFKPDEDKKI